MSGICFKDAAFDFQIKEQGNERTIEGYGSIFNNVDSHSDVVAPGAFKGSLTAYKPKMLWQHDYRQVAGVWEKCAEDTKGLHMKGRFIDTQAGRDGYVACKEGAVDSLSIGYLTNKYSIDKVQNVRVLEDVKLLEVSLVTFPSNEAAKIVAVKNTPLTEREFEQFLRDVGLSHAQAKAFISGGYKSISGLRDEGVQGAELEELKQIEEIEQILKNNLQKHGAKYGTIRN